MRSIDEFLQRIETELRQTRPVNVRDATRAVLQLLSRNVNRGQVDKVRQSLPEDLRAIWHDDPNAPEVRPRPERYSAGADGDARAPHGQISDRSDADASFEERMSPPVSISIIATSKTCDLKLSAES